jgi:peptidoglycan/LPS O-acetylase OafA/YrhL
MKETVVNFSTRSLTPSQYTVDPHFYRFWPAIGAIYLVYILDRCTLLQKIFTTRLAQYLGKISFSIYLVHFYIFMVLGQPLLGQFWGLTGKDTDAGYFWGFVMAYVIIFSVTVWVADVFTRLVDENCVKFSKWVYQQLVTLSIE